MDSGGRHVLERIRELCDSFPATSERRSHGAPTFFVCEKRAFLAYRENHHGDGRVAIWCAAAPGVQAALVEAAPDRYFVPPYVGHRGWLGLRLDRGAEWDEIAGVVEDAYLARAPKRLLASAGLDERPPS